MDSFDWVRDVNPSQFTLVPHKLDDYVDGSLNIGSNMNVLINDRSQDWYNNIGEFAYNYYKKSGKSDPQMDMFVNMADRTIEDQSGLARLNPLKRTRPPYSSFGIFIITGMNRDVLEKMFGGEPIYHDHFGEGFDGEYNEELDDYDEPEIRESYASYMVEVNGYTFHLGYDHRGISIEVDTSLSAETIVDKIMKPIVKSYIDNL